MEILHTTKTITQNFVVNSSIKIASNIVVVVVVITMFNSEYYCSIQNSSNKHLDILDLSYHNHLIKKSKTL